MTIKIYDILGDEVECLINGKKPAGIYKIKWAPEGLPSGIYFYRMQAEGFHVIKNVFFKDNLKCKLLD